MKSFAYLTSFGLVCCLASTLALAAPQQASMARGGHGGPSPQLAKQHTERRMDGAHQQRPPQDFRPLQQQIYPHRHSIGRGPALPARVYIVKGRPMPYGWGKPLNRHQRRYVPYYPGYEWRRTGSDLVLVAISTGIVFEILHGVLD